MLRLAFVSSWHVHTDDYLNQIKENSNAKIVAMWDENKEKGEEWAKKQEIEFIENYDELLTRSDIDGIICNSPTTMHFELLSKAAKSKKHIFTEKLLTTNTKEGIELCKLIKDSGVVCTVSLPLLSEPYFIYAKQLIENNILGRISGARMRRSHNGVSDNWLPERWYDVSLSGGGALMDLGAHPVYVLSYLFGKPVRVSAMTSNLYDSSSDENANVLIEFDKGIITTAETAFVTYGVPDILEIYGDEGSLFIHGDSIELITKNNVKVNLPNKRPLPLTQFIDACINDLDSPEDFNCENALIMTEIIDCAYNSNESNKTIKFSNNI